MWVPTRQDAVAIYARFCLAHYGYNALFKAEQQAARLAQLGDGDGKKIWDEVASEIKKVAYVCHLAQEDREQP